MRIGISTASFFNRKMIEDLPALYEEWGVKNAEYFLNSFSEYEPDFIALLAERTQKHGITVCSIHPMSSIAFVLSIDSLLLKKDQESREFSSKLISLFIIII